MIRRRRGRHAWTGSAARNLYTVVYAPRRGEWVRLISFGGDDWVLLDLDNKVLAPTPDPVGPPSACRCCAGAW